MAKVKCVVVTPESTVFDEEVDDLVLPMFDGELGVLPGRAAMIGRLGYGRLKLHEGGKLSKSYFIDGGFVQVEDNVVSLLTARALELSQIDTQQAQKDLAAALEMPSSNEHERQVREAATMRARGMIRAVHPD